MIDYEPHDWPRHLFAVRGTMLRELVSRVAAFALWSVAVVAVHRYVQKVDIPATVHSLVGVALGLLLVFRTNASYDRFWEGRKMWGGIVNETRNLVRLACVHLAQAPELLIPIVRWTAAWPFSSMYSLRGQRGLGPVANQLPAREVEEALASQHAPLHVAARISSLLNEARRRGLISDILLTSIDANVQLLVDYIGACERIHRTPLPFAYVVHLRRALILYCFTLPFALLEPFGWHAVSATLSVAFIFFGIEEIGVEIEDPFGEDDNDLPLERICSTIHGNLVALLERTLDTSAAEAPRSKESQELG